MSQQQLTRSESDRMVAGVCGGLATYLNLDPVFVRLAFVILGVASGIGVAIYFILWLVMPSEAQGLDANIILNEKSPDDPALLKTRENSAGTVGVLLVLLGGFFLLNQLGWIGGAFWPVVAIAAGAYFLIRHKR